MNDVQDLRAAAVQFEALQEISPLQKVLTYGLAGLAGAGAVGLVLLASALVARRRRDRVVSNEGVMPSVSSAHS